MMLQVTATPAARNQKIRLLSLLLPLPLPMIITMATTVTRTVTTIITRGHRNPP